MAWLVLVASGVLEAVWATALNKSDGFSRLLPSLVFAVALLFSMTGLAFAMRSLPTGTSYAVWVGIGAVLTVGYAMLDRRRDGVATQGGADRRRGRLHRGPEANQLTGRSVSAGNSARPNR